MIRVDQNLQPGKMEGIAGSWTTTSSRRRIGFIR